MTMQQQAQGPALLLQPMKRICMSSSLYTLNTITCRFKERSQGVHSKPQLGLPMTHMVKL
jgi:hypothetical protein